MAQIFNPRIIFQFQTLDGPIKETWKVWVKNVKSNPSVEQAPFAFASEYTLNGKVMKCTMWLKAWFSK